MSIANALALTALAPLLAAMILAANVPNTRTRKGERRVRAIGWATFTLSLVFFVAAIWTEASYA